ncbi:hypothetical protein ADL00_22880 [Streptomyces sp. AS58]|uniref:Uncharacterized protein n=1 Tax=Streptomyces cadmiisoli TaxID=2184053 RepID=A0A2Z4IYY1_9ACTN|nr:MULTISPECIES: hypothetical protein [Streptomyces]AWW38009.1 hypothetical protein DN051_16265 [Streptomyces cadmiisoli]KOV63793.1 hypothetical protein ADL00_22880 [Streptomyces sp. AS58]
MTTGDEPSVRLGDVSHSTFAIGSHARAESHHGTGDRRDPAAEELLAAVRELRADLTRVRADGRTAELDTELAGTEEEITRTGAVGQGRLQRLRQLLTDSEALVSLLASAGAVAGLLGM